MDQLQQRRRWPAWVIAGIGSGVGTFAGAIAGGAIGAFVAEHLTDLEGLEELGPFFAGAAIGALVLSVAGAFVALALRRRRGIAVPLLVGAVCPIATFFILIWWPYSAIGVAALLVFAVRGITGAHTAEHRGSDSAETSERDFASE